MILHVADAPVLSLPKQFFRGSLHKESLSPTLHSTLISLDYSSEKTSTPTLRDSEFAVNRPADERPKADRGLLSFIVRHTLPIKSPRLISFHNIKAVNPDAPSAGIDNNLDTCAISTSVDLVSPENHTPQLHS